MIRKPLLILALLLPLLASAQDLSYAREVVDTLASKSFSGRGYVNSGDKTAADYISSEFKKIGLESFQRGYFQKFSTPVNSFPGTMELALNGITLKAGTDYLIEPGSPAVNGSFSTVTITTAEMFDLQALSGKLRSAAGKFIVIPTYDKGSYSKEQQQQIQGVINFLRYHPDNPAAGSVIFTRNKLTWSASTRLNAKASFTVHTEVDEPTAMEKVKVNVKNKFFKQYKTQNVMGYVEGTNTDSLIVLTAHYDHLGMMGSDAIFPGANDNASGIAMLLSLAKHFQANKPEYTTVFMAFGAEELGLLGAKHYVENPLFPLESIKFLINFDITGTGDEGIQVVNGKLYRDKFDRLVKLNEEQNLLAQVKIRGEACNSDHCMFHQQKVPAFYIYTLGGIQAYHDIHDRSETLPLTEFGDYFKLVKAFIDGL
ncbi:MAG: M20/M25/M40 family metallo-hydrolase [Roseivirga sp.]|nr:M20/M25/M40 family metallo-hydrolase [Roseivirga sp.]